MGLPALSIDGQYSGEAPGTTAAFRYWWVASYVSPSHVVLPQEDWNSIASA
jgi:hypothetical protein